MPPTPRAPAPPGAGGGAFHGVADQREPHALAVGDLNGDNKLDLVAGNYNAAAVATLPIGGAPQVNGLAVAELSGDGKADVAAACQDKLVVYLGKGDGTLNAAVSYAGGQTPYAVAAGGFNGDGKNDLVMAHATGGGDVGVYHRGGGGRLQRRPAPRRRGHQRPGADDGRHAERVGQVTAQARPYRSSARTTA